MEAIVLAGGMGTRLKSVISDIPKPMAPIIDKPFLWYILENLYRNQVKHVVLATGFKHECIEEYFGNQYKTVMISYSKEDTPLGTGGAIKKALELIKGPQAVVLNGDTFFKVNLRNLLDEHLSQNSDLTLSLKPMENFDRYGVVVTSGSKVLAFEEKQFRQFGHINGGVYVMKKNIFDKTNLIGRFSFETDLVESYVNILQFNAYICDEYFIDIGVPEDYCKAQLEMNRFLTAE